MSESQNLGFDKLNAVFVLSFLLVLAGALMMFASNRAWIVVSSMVGMFLGFCSMLLVLGLEID